MIHTLSHLSYVLKIDVKEIEYIVTNIDKYYKEFKEQKYDAKGNEKLNKDGSLQFRVFHPSKDRLKQIQERINDNVLSKIPLPKYCFGAIKKRDNVLHAKYHQGNVHFFNTDLKSFFPSIRHPRVYKLFIRKGFSPDVSRVLTAFTTYKGKLPQGVPTSSYISNLIFEETGDKLSALAKADNMKFSTFIDDVVISSKTDFKIRVQEFIELIKADGFSVSHKKTSYKTKNPEVTGVIVKNNNLALSKKTKAKLKAVEPNSNSHKGLLNYVNKIKKANHSKVKQLINV